MIERRIGENITLENRNFANIEVNKRLRYNQILECLGNKKLTAKELANEMYKREMIPTNERNYVSPRLTELAQIGIVEPVGRKKCEWTGKSVSVWKIREV
jgi:hypothetical protein